MEGWVDLGALITPQPGIKPTTAWSKVRHPNCCTTKTLTRQLMIVITTEISCTTDNVRGKYDVTCSRDQWNVCGSLIYQSVGLTTSSGQIVEILDCCYCTVSLDSRSVAPPSQWSETRVYSMCVGDASARCNMHNTDNVDDIWAATWCCGWWTSDLPDVLDLWCQISVETVSPLWIECRTVWIWNVEIP